MEVRKHAVVELEYELRVSGEVVESTNGEPVSVLCGHGAGLPPGLEEALYGRGPGAFSVALPPERGAGIRAPELVFVASRANFPAGEVLEVGDEFYFEDESGRARPARVMAVEGESVTVDANPRYAGEVLEYRGTIHRVREADPEEIDHGHVHGAGGCHQ
jgi:FKBP-type peptidyl-prolyl cis-trans isomerase SlyD